MHLPRNIAVLVSLSVIGPLAVGQDSNVKLSGAASMVSVGQKVSNFYKRRCTILGQVMERQNKLIFTMFESKIKMF